MNSDSISIQSTTHFTCEDSSVTIDNDDLSIAIVCDGCSSSENSDIGSRLLSIIAKDAMCEIFKRDLVYEDHIREYIIQKMIEVKNSCSFLNTTFFDSTLMILVKPKDSYARVLVYGDGVIFKKEQKSTNIEICEISFSHNAPYYLNYKTDSKRDSLYLKNSSEEICFRTGLTTGEHNIPVADAIPAYYTINGGEPGFIGIASDGISQLLDRNTGTMLATEEVIKNLTDFKTTTGQFVKRRVKRAMEEYAKNGIIPVDDLSIAVIHY